MENKFQTSFIPKGSFEDKGSVHIKTPRNLLYIIGIFMIVIALLGAAGVFGYSFFLDRRIETAKGEVTAKEKSFNYAAVQNIVDVDHQLKAAGTLLKNHTAISRVFDVLEENTLKNLRFSSFEFSYISPSKVTLAMKGQAKTFGTVAKQAELLSSSSSTRMYFRNPLFSDLNLDDKGNVTFSFLTTLDPTLIAYQSAAIPPAGAGVRSTSTVQVQPGQLATSTTQLRPNTTSTSTRPASTTNTTIRATTTPQ